MRAQLCAEKITPYDRDNLACSFLKSIRRFYSDPANVERFEKWKREKEKREQLERSQNIGR